MDGTAYFQSLIRIWDTGSDPRVPVFYFFVFTFFTPDHAEKYCFPFTVA